jgi:hypothetical protein
MATFWLAREYGMVGTHKLAWTYRISKRWSSWRREWSGDRWLWYYKNTRSFFPLLLLGIDAVLLADNGVDNVVLNRSYACVNITPKVDLASKQLVS